MKRFILLGVILLSTNIKAQTFDWVKTILYNQIVQSGYVAIEGATCDENGDVYSVSYGTSQIDFSYNNSSQTVPSGLFVSGVIIKSNSTGSQIWKKYLVPDINSGGTCQPKRIQYKNGFIYVAGNISGNIDMNPNSGVNNLYGYSSSFIAKYDTTGSLLWAKEFGGFADSKVNDITIDNNDNLYLTGSYSATFSFNNVNYYHSGGTDIFLLKYNSNGIESWCNVFGSSSSDYEQGNGVFYDEINDVVIACGNFAGQVDFNPSNSTSNLVSNGLLDGYLVKYDVNGNYINGISIGSTDTDLLNSIALSGNNLILTGRIGQGPVDMDGTVGVQIVNTNPGGTCFILKLNVNFQYQWVKMLSASASTGVRMQLRNGILYTIGSFVGTIDLNPDPIAENNCSTPSNSISATFISKLDLNGAYVWGGAILNTSDVWTQNTYSYYHFASAVVVTNNGLYVSGGFKGPMDFDPSPTVISNTPSSITPTGIGIMSGFLVKLINCNPTINSLELSSCGPYNWNGQTYVTSGTYTQNLQNSNGCDSTVTLNLTINSSTSSSFSETSCEPYTWNGNTYASSGQYSQTLSGSNGCDSIVTLNLTILNGPTAQVTQDGLLLTANTVSGASYQWIYCSDLTPVPNQTFSQFAPQANGTYAVVITDNCGSDTSDCITISTIGIDEVKSVFQVYPNPVNSELNVEIDLTVSEAIYSILDLNYRIIHTGKILQSQPINVRSLADGTYILKIESLGYVRFIKQ